MKVFQSLARYCRREFNKGDDNLHKGVLRVFQQLQTVPQRFELLIALTMAQKKLLAQDKNARSHHKLSEMQAYNRLRDSSLQHAGFLSEELSALAHTIATTAVDAEACYIFFATAAKARHPHSGEGICRGPRSARAPTPAYATETRDSEITTTERASLAL
jgi:hypothetical protein